MTKGSVEKEAGFSLLEMLVVLLLFASLVALAIPHLLRATGGHRVRLAAAETVTVLRLAKAHAVRVNAHVGVKFVLDDRGAVHYRIYQDGDGDGVRTRDIESGVDGLIPPSGRLSHLGSRVGFGFPPGKAPRDPGNPKRRLNRLEDPIRFNRSNIASFGPLGTSTPGSLYLTDHREQLVVVRVVGLTGRIRTLVYDRDEEIWR